MTLAKALGNGFPIGAILINQKVTKGSLLLSFLLFPQEINFHLVLDYGDHGSTFAGQPLASVAANVLFFFF